MNTRRPPRARMFAARARAAAACIGLPACLWLAACNPTLNWREARLDEDRLVALLPCKPDQATRQLPLLGLQQPGVDVSMTGCEAAGATWAVAHARVADPGQAALAMQHWKQATLAQVRGSAGAEHSVRIQAPAGEPPVQGLLTVVRGQSAAGAGVALQAVYFVRANRVYQAVVVGSQTDPAAVETFVSGLVLR